MNDVYTKEVIDTKLELINVTLSYIKDVVEKQVESTEKLIEKVQAVELTLNTVEVKDINSEELVKREEFKDLEKKIESSDKRLEKKQTKLMDKMNVMWRERVLGISVITLVVGVMTAVLTSIIIKTLGL